MTRYTLTLLEHQYSAIQQDVFRDDSERAALMICGRSSQIDPWTGVREERFIARELIRVEDLDYLSRRRNGFTWSTKPIQNVAARATRTDSAVAIIHSHPTDAVGHLRFSWRDDIADDEHFKIVLNRTGTDKPHLSVVVDRIGNIIARAFDSDLSPHPVELIRVIGHRWKFIYESEIKSSISEEFDRQVRVFGKPAIRDLSQLRIGLVGCGGTGSAVAMLLARIGVRRIALFDPDRIDDTSLNRLHFSGRKDANLMSSKAEVVANGIADIGLPISIVRFSEHVESEVCRDTLRSCDVVFGCTDDHLGRNFLNRLAHFYLIPVVDLGLSIEPNDRGEYDAFDGRVTVVQPGYPCQICRGLIQSKEMLAEDLRRHDPALYQARRRAGYVTGAPDPAPVVVTFTTELAAMAVNEVFQRLTGFRGDAVSCGERVRRFDEVKDSDTVPAGKTRPGCPLCDERKYDGRGDMVPFLDQA